MLIKLALGNVRRSAHDFSVYFLTLAFAVCLLYSFLASTDYLLALELSPDQRAAYAQAGGVLQAFAVFIDVIFCFLLGYANAFLLRRRKREFGIYLMLGIGRLRVALVLMVECAVAGAASLACGLAMGWVLSPAFSLVAAFVFGVSWRPVILFSASAAVQCACSFVAISAVAAAAAVRWVSKRPLVELMRFSGVPERRSLGGGMALRVQKVAAAMLLALVWGTCLLSPGYFIVFIIPMGFVALFGSYFLIRVLAVCVPERLRAHTERYWAGLTPFTVRQLEARAETGAMAMAAECVLLAASLCMTVAGFAFSVGMRMGELVEGAEALLPIAYACVFYGAAFLIAAAAVLALQQLARAADDAPAYRTLAVLGVSLGMRRASARAQIGVGFVMPTVLALIHCLFGFVLIGMITIMMEADGFFLFAGGAVGLTLGILGVYYLLTVRVASAALTRHSEHGSVR